MASAIIVFSHLRWDVMFHRPQHVLTRLAAHHPIVFVEEPVYYESQSFFRTYSPGPDILVCQPHTPVNMPGFHDDHLPYLQKLLREIVHDYPEHIGWFYTPMALPLLQELDPRMVVVDCMDELAAFINAPRQLLQRESALLKVADLVFTGGQNLYRAKCDRHPNVHFIPCSVEAAHFEPALDRTNSHPAHRDIPGPRLGFYGMIDERIDVDLIAAVADAHPMWQLVLVGPVVKIDPSLLPQRANIHYLGPYSYEALPQFLAGWDVCMLPFVRNESSRFMSLTTTLEYMAAELPIVSTPLAEVAEAYGDIVTIADDAQSFIRACEAALLSPQEEHARKVKKMRSVLASTSWDATVEKMHLLMEETPARAGGRRWSDVTVALTTERPASVNLIRQHAPPRDAKTIILGAGPTGLSTAFHLGHDAVVLERNETVGGGCRSIKEKGFTFDHAGHIMSSPDPYVAEMVELLLGSNLQWQHREACVYTQKGYMPYPFQSALHGMPPERGEENAIGRGDLCANIAPHMRFDYPIQGGLQSLMSGFVPHIKGTVELNADVIHLSPANHTLTLADGRRYQYDQMISTIPLPELVTIIGSEAPVEVRQAAAGLKHLSARCVHLGVARKNITDKHWIYYPEETIFYRIFAQGNASPECNAPGGFALTCEITYSPEWKPLSVSDKDLIDRCIQDCIKVGLLRNDDSIIVANETDMPYAYVVHDHARAGHVDTIKAWLARHDIALAGRYSEWECDSSEHAFIAGRKAADLLKWMDRKSAVGAAD